MSGAEKPKYLIRRDGSLLTLGDLPCPKTKRWVIRRKAVVVDAVRGGLITVQDACLRYSLTLEEFFAWRRAVEQFGTEAFERNASAGLSPGGKEEWSSLVESGSWAKPPGIRQPPAEGQHSDGVSAIVFEKTTKENARLVPGFAGKARLTTTGE